MKEPGYGERPGADDPAVVLERNREVWAPLYLQRRANLDSMVERIRDPHATIRAQIELSHAARCMWGGEMLDRIPGANVLEVGGGSGELACMMLALGAERVVTTEITEEAALLMAALRDELGYGDRMEIHIGDFLAMPLGEEHSFDLVIGKEVLHHVTTADEDAFVARMAEYVGSNGMVRLSDPAVNSRTLDALRWAIPVPGRPSKLIQRRAYGRWKANDEHPERDNSTSHVLKLFSRHFESVEVHVTGTLARYHRLANSDKWHDSVWAKLTALDEKVPVAVQAKLGNWHGISAYMPRVSGRSTTGNADLTEGTEMGHPVRQDR